MHKILLVGNDPSLLRSRACLLNDTQAVEILTACPSELDQNARSQDFGLLVLCHTLDLAARLKISTEAHRRWPQAQVMQVLKDYYSADCAPAYADDAVLAWDPEELVRHARILLKMSAASRLAAA